MHSTNLRTNIIRCPRCLACKALHFACHYGKSFTSVARASGFDRRIECEKIRLLGDVIDPLDYLSDSIRRFCQTRKTGVKLKDGLEMTEVDLVAA